MNGRTFSTAVGVPFVAICFSIFFVATAGSWQLQIILSLGLAVQSFFALKALWHAGRASAFQQVVDRMDAR